MMDRIFLHIGYPKTGTSAIQTTLAASRQALSDAGIFFPNVHAGLCNGVAARFYSRPQILFPYCEMPPVLDTIQLQIESDFSRIDSDFRQSSCPVGVISSESLIALEPENIRRLRDWLLSRAAVITVLCYVRRPTSYAASVIQERVKWGERLPLPASNLPIGRFEHQIPYWEAVFGHDAMIVRSASREDLVGGDAVTDFAHLLGYGGELNRSSEYRNEGISHAAVLLMDALNALDQRLVSSNLGFQELWKLPGEKYRLSPDLARSVNVQARPHLDYLRARWGIEFRDEADAATTPDLFGKATADSLAEFIAELHKQARSNEPSPFRERW